MDDRRLLLEKHYLDDNFPRQFVFCNISKAKPLLDGNVKSNKGVHYRLKITLNNFPEEMPAVYVTYPHPLPGYNIPDLAEVGVSADLHLLDPDPEGHIQICHYKGSDWSGNQTLYHIMLHAKIWLDAYEKYMRDGTHLDYYLKH